ncbi:succinate dehydrogenase [Pacificibacter maritimus]|uniref:succinate dehydrogenase n=1 Tax=Pacificibacter maritimus TaxID=762213 RepID=UPI001473236E|nr:succinate dehydrogenase [Pacificibacter maritimus]
MGILAATALLSGCLAPEMAVEQTVRSTAKGVINSVISQKLPGVNAEPYVECIVDQASTDELVTLARAAVTGVDNSTVSIVTSIASQPETISCIAQNGLGVMLG